TRANVETMRSKLDRDKDLGILQWLTPIDYGPQQSDFIKRRQEGTGTWLLCTNEMDTWLDRRNETLFCSGIPGAGKTILTSIVVDHLCSKYRANLDVGIAYIYCNFRQQQQQRPEDLLLSLLKQLLQKRTSAPESIRTLYESHSRERTRPSFNKILEALNSVAAMYSRVLVIVDALDECGVSNGERQKFLSAIFNLQGKTGANLFVTSRINDNISKLFEGALSLQIRASNEDVESYLDAQISLLQSDIWDNNLRDRVKREVVSVVDGMFLLAQLHMNTLRNQPTKGHVKEVLQHLAKGVNGLDETYKQAMERIKDQGRPTYELANHILGWIVHAKTPLSTRELQHALAVKSRTRELNEDYVPSQRFLRSVCAGLVTIDEQSGVVRLVHYTTQEYFERTWTTWFPYAQTDITNVCVTYLSFNVFEAGFCQSDREFEARLQTHVFYDYAARNWGYHAQTALIDEDLILGFLQSRSKISAASQAMMASRNYSDYSQEVPREMTGVHVAAYFGLEGAIIDLLNNGRDPDNSKDSYGQTPLLRAAQSGHEAVVKLLLETSKVDINSKDSYGQTPLSRAAEDGHETVVKLLLETGKVDVDSKDTYGETPL
ncbi:ankyrin, partial [Zopfia rhizophila CBS 207.26]